MSENRISEVVFSTPLENERPPRSEVTSETSVSALQKNISDHLSSGTLSPEILQPDYQKNLKDMDKALSEVIDNMNDCVFNRLEALRQDLQQKYGVTDQDRALYQNGPNRVRPLAFLLGREKKGTQLQQRYEKVQKFNNSVQSAKIGSLVREINIIKQESTEIRKQLSEGNFDQTALSQIVVHANRLHQIEHADLNTLAEQIASFQEVSNSSSS